LKQIINDLIAQALLELAQAAQIPAELSVWRWLNRPVLRRVHWRN